MNDDGRLGPGARAFIAEPDHDILISMASLWEIAVKTRIGKLQADLGDILAVLERDGFTLLDITVEHLAVLARLPTFPDHRDPFDHLLIAQAIAEGATFLSEDRHVRRYGVAWAACSG